MYDLIQCLAKSHMSLVATWFHNSGQVVILSALPRWYWFLDDVSSSAVMVHQPYDDVRSSRCRQTAVSSSVLCRLHIVYVNADSCCLYNYPEPCIPRSRFASICCVLLSTAGADQTCSDRQSSGSRYAGIMQIARALFIPI